MNLSRRVLLPAAVLLMLLAPSVMAMSGWSVQVWRADGLPERNVRSVAQTSDGFLWAVTPDYLSRFDGSQFEAFPVNRLGHGLTNRLHAVLASRNGGLWLAFEDGVVGRLLPGTAQLVRPGLPNTAATTIAEDADGAAWISFRTGDVVRILNGEVSDFTSRLPEGRAILASDSLGRIWFAKGGQVGIFRNGRFETLLHTANVTTQLARTPDDGMWICTTRLGRLHEGKPLEDHGRFPGAKPTALLEDHSGAVWIGTAYSGLFRFDGSRFESVPTSHREILGLFEDREGNIWAGTDGGGLNRITPRAVQLEGAEAGLALESVQSVCEDSDGKLWAVTHEGSLVARESSGWTIDATSLPNDRVLTCLAADPAQGIWIGTRRQKLLWVHGGQVRAWTKSDGLTSLVIRQLLAGTNDVLWIHGEAPTRLYRLRDGHLDTFTLPPDVRLSVAMAEDNAGRLWVGSESGRLLRIEGSDVVDYSSRIDHTGVAIRALHAASDGSLWIGFQHGGVGRLTEKSFARIDSRDGLYNDGIWEIGADGRGWFWLGSDAGLFKVRESELIAVAEQRSRSVQSFSYAGAYGLPAHPDFSDHDHMLLTRDGRLLVPMGTALATIAPDKLREDLTPPPVHVQRVVVDDRTIASYGGLVPATGAELQREAAVRPAAGYGKLRIDFSGLSFFAPENVHFRYQLEGFDRDWIDAGPQRSASYSRLSPGAYTFRVKACNSSGIWNETGAQLAVIVAPTLWQTAWFRCAVITAAGLAMIAVVRLVSFRRLQGKVRALQQEAAIHKERIRIARDIHDDVGNRLTKIMLLTSSALRGEPETKDRQLQQVFVTTRQVADALDEIVWAVNPKNDTLSELIDYLAQFAAEFLQSAGIRCQMDLPLHPPAKNLPAEVRHNLFLATKEALNNVVRHAGATDVKLAIRTDHEVEIIVADNGRGFAAAPDDAGADGLRNMRQRVAEIGGRCDVTSSPAGTRVSLVYPWARV